MDDRIKNYFVAMGFMDHFQVSLNKLADSLNKPRIVIPYENIPERSVIPSEKSTKIHIENSK